MNKFLNKDFTMKKSSSEVVAEERNKNFEQTKDEFNIQDKRKNVKPQLSESDEKIDKQEDDDVRTDL